jgi:uncharacterized protein YcbK (DUF882 family)
MAPGQVKAPELPPGVKQAMKSLTQDYIINRTDVSVPAVLANKYGVDQKLWSTLSPYIDKYKLNVIEGYRDPKTASDKSAENSMHYLGKAMDLDYSNLSVPERIALVKDLKAAGITGFGTGTNTLHADIGIPRNWWYTPDGMYTTDPQYKPSWIKGLF